MNQWTRINLRHLLFGYMPATAIVATGWTALPESLRTLDTALAFAFSVAIGTAMALRRNPPPDPASQLHFENELAKD
jgi:hypothetical protein